ncbi:hypothetical protein FA95DRAFT_1587318 [Auriscalpium vulgare]|uniref:Uncharacterized protein n=1 Tax=Auriscalpium vulgare TaxID=40419 RepID=A0ACB8S5P0_9AGAM|nr:hypothetical protein FA95DRAFT_1587318 [Auriscalpium vulgare]
MLRNIIRTSLRRRYHTAPPSSLSGSVSRPRLAMALGASAAGAAYLTWRIASETNKIALDSDSTRKMAPTAAKTAFADEADQLAPASSSFSPDDPLEGGESPEVEGEGEEGSSGGAYDPVTGKINWDCACLGGMAYGPCGMQFREAFSCFVFSEEEPKGIDCVEKFKAMQDCFRENPDVYGEEIMGDDEDDDLPQPVPPEARGDETVVGIPETIVLEPSVSVPTSAS